MCTHTHTHTHVHARTRTPNPRSIPACSPCNNTGTGAWDSGFAWLSWPSVGGEEDGRAASGRPELHPVKALTLLSPALAGPVQWHLHHRGHHHRSGIFISPKSVLSNMEAVGPCLDPGPCVGFLLGNKDAHPGKDPLLHGAGCWALSVWELGVRYPDPPQCLCADVCKLGFTECPKARLRMRGHHGWLWEHSLVREAP